MSSSNTTPQKQIKLLPYLQTIYPTIKFETIGDYFVLHRPTKPSILFMNYDEIYNVEEKDVLTFHTLLQKEGVCGVFISQHSGFVGKNNYHIDVLCKTAHVVSICIHNADYSAEKIRIAVDVIDSLHPVLISASIPQETEITEKMNHEYLQFLSGRERLYKNIKETQKQNIQLLEQLEFPFLENFIQSKIPPEPKLVILCDICNNYEAPSVKSLSAHKRGCEKKHGAPTTTPTPTVAETIAVETL